MLLPSLPLASSRKLGLARSPSPIEVPPGVALVSFLLVGQIVEIKLRAARGAVRVRRSLARIVCGLGGYPLPAVLAVVARDKRVKNLTNLVAGALGYLLVRLVQGRILTVLRKRFPQPNNFLNASMRLRRQCSNLNAFVPNMGAMHIGQHSQVHGPS